MEALRDLALADYENLQEESKIRLDDRFKKMIADGSDFSEYFELNPFSPNVLSPWLDTCEIYKKKRLDFEEFITLEYISDNSEVVILCKGCSSMISGRPYFICDDCFDDLSDGQSYNLCCDCYRTKNFQGHEHTSFSCNHSRRQLRKAREEALEREKQQECRNEFIDQALTEFGNEFMEFAVSIATDPEKWKKRFGRGESNHIKKDKNVKKDEKEENSTTVSGARGSSRHHDIDLLGVRPSPCVAPPPGGRGGEEEEAAF